MTKEFEYLARIVVDSSIKVEDIGNCAIEANNDIGQTWSMIVRTELGISEIFEVGPVMPDTKERQRTCFISYKKIPYSETNICKSIDKFLNDSHRGITQAREIDVEEAKEYFINLAEYI